MSSVGCTEHVDVPISVHIRRVDRPSSVKRSVDGVLGPRRTIAGRVLPPGDGTGPCGRADHIGVTITVHVRCVDRDSTIERLADGVPGNRHRDSTASVTVITTVAMFESPKPSLTR